MPENRTLYYGKQAKKKAKQTVYWRKREQQAIKTEAQRDMDTVKDVIRVLNMMLDEIEKSIHSFIAKYGDFEGVPLSEAKKKIERFDADAFQEKAKQLVADKDFSKEANKQLKKYNTKLYVSREEFLKEQIRFAIDHATAINEKQIKEHLESSAAREAKRQSTILGKNMSSVRYKKAKAVVDQQYYGVLWSKRLWTNSEKMKKEVEKSVANVVVRGSHPKEYVKDVRKHIKDVDMAGKKKTESTKTLLLTESARVQAQVMIDNFKEFDPDGEYEYIAKLDERTSKVCRGLDGKRFKVKDAKVGVNFFPMHPNCRSSAALVPRKK